MTLETLTSSELPTCLVYDTISATPLHHHHPHDPSSSTQTFLFGGNAGAPAMLGGTITIDSVGPAAGVQVMRRKRRRRQRSCKNKEEAESQRMTHIAVERNRRRLMNEHLNVLRSLMPESYIQRGDQASIVGGAIDFVKELEQLLQSLEVQKRTLIQQQQQQQQQQQIQQAVKEEEEVSTNDDHIIGGSHYDYSCSSTNSYTTQEEAPFAHFFAYPQFIWCHSPRDYPPMPISENPRSAVADIEVTLIETHANLRILTLRRPRQLLAMVAGLQALRLSILHLNVTTLDSMVLYSLSAKVEEGCNLTTVDDIAAAVHHMLTLIDADSTPLTQ